MKISERILEKVIEKTLSKGVTMSIRAHKDEDPTVNHNPKPIALPPEGPAVETDVEVDRRDEKIALLSGILIGVGVTFVAMRSLR